MSPEALRRRDQGFVPAPAVLEPQGNRNFQEMCAALLSDRQTSLQAVHPYRQERFEPFNAVSPRVRRP